MRLVFLPWSLGGRAKIRNARRVRLQAYFVLVAATTVAATTTGCGIQGEPTVRRPPIPKPVTDLSASQQGDSIVLEFTLPHDSMNDKPLPELPGVQIFRDTRTPESPPTNPIVGTHKPSLPGRLVDTISGDAVSRYVKDGHVNFADPLNPAQEYDQPPSELFYTLRIQGSNGRASADSNTVALRIYPAPQPVMDLEANLGEKAVTLTWTAPTKTTTNAPLESALSFRVYRALASPESAVAAATTDSGSAGAVEQPNEFTLLGEVAEPEYRDTTFQSGISYAYMVRSSTQYGSTTVQSKDSPVVILSTKDVFPPAAPQGLEAVLIPETANMPAYVEVTWGISTDPGITGYAVYRSEEANVRGMRLNQQLLPVPAYRDTAVETGHSYFYSVAAVDQSGNESPVSSQVEVVLP